MHAHKERPEGFSVHTRNEAMKNVFARCHEKTAVLVCIMTIMHCCLITVKYSRHDLHEPLSNISCLSLPSLYVRNLIIT
jgi:hypothetical protein